MKWLRKVQGRTDEADELIDETRLLSARLKIVLAELAAHIDELEAEIRGGGPDAGH